MTFYERKAKRTEYYFKYIYGWKLRKCVACNGSGRYDHKGSPKCGACHGSGKKRYNANINNS
jgi:DnaJ-class molecular chaperone